MHFLIKSKDIQQLFQPPVIPLRHNQLYIRKRRIQLTLQRHILNRAQIIKIHNIILTNLHKRRINSQQISSSRTHAKFIRFAISSKHHLPATQFS